MKGRSCLATVTDDGFAIGAEVMLYSFLKRNPWFDGDVVVLIDTLSQAARDRLRAVAPVRFVEGDSRLREKTAALMRRESTSRDLFLRFLTLDAFRLEGYERVVYLDSDLFCTGDLSELFQRTEPLLACYDGYTCIQGLNPVLERAGLPPVDRSHRYGRFFESSFSAGVLSLSGELLASGIYHDLLARIDGFDLASARPFTDQHLLNVYFKDRFTPVSARYNYRTNLEAYIRYFEGLSWFDASIIHFAGKIKPWNNYRLTDLLASAPQYIKYIDLWREVLDEIRHRDDPAFAAGQILDQMRFVEQGLPEGVPAIVDRLV